MEERTVIISRVIKLKALGASERKLGNHGAADTCESKVKTLIAKYSITERELGITHTTYSNPKPQYQEPPKSSQRPPSYSSMEDALRDHVRKMEEDMKRNAQQSYNEYQRAKSSYNPYSGFKEEKIYRYRNELTCSLDIDVRRLFAAMCAECDVDIEEFEKETNESFFRRATKQVISFSVQGSASDLKDFKALFLKVQQKFQM